MEFPINYDEGSSFVDLTVRAYTSKRSSTKKLQKLAGKVDAILREELKKNKVRPSFAETRILDCKSVGVQGDERTYGYPAEITLYQGKEFIWKRRTSFLEHLSNRITNEVCGVNRVIYTTAKRDSVLLH